MDKIFIAGIRIDTVSKIEALERCREFLRDGKQHRIATVNPEFVVEAQKNKAFRSVLQKSDLALADGTGIVLATRLLCGKRIGRIPGVEFMEALCGLAVKEGASVFFLGGRGEAAQKTADVLKGKFPALNIVGWSEDERVDISTYRNFDILFVALGAPKQELWVAENLPKLSGVKIAMGVGGSFDFISGKIKRAPQWMRSMGLEWLWRFLCEPRRLKRIFTAIIIFPFVALARRKS